MMNQMTMSPLTAKFKKLKSGEAWCCAFANCKGVVGYVREGSPDAGLEFYVELPLNYALRKDVYRPTQRASLRNKDLNAPKETVKQWHKFAWDEANIGASDDPEFQSFRATASAMKTQQFAQNSRSGVTLIQAKLPVLVACPGCGRTIKISSVRK